MLDAFSWGLLALFLSVIACSSVAKKLRLGLPMLAALIVYCGAYTSQPVLNPTYGGFWFAMLISGIIVAGSAYLTMGFVPKAQSLEEDRRRTEHLAKQGMAVALVPLFALLVLIGVTLCSWSGFRSTGYHDLIGTVEHRDFDAQTVSPVDLQNMRIVDEGVAEYMAEKRLGEIPGLGARVELDTMHQQPFTGCVLAKDSQSTLAEPPEQEFCFKNELVWVGALKHRGFSTWWANGTTPGFVLVSARDNTRTYLVTQVKTEGVAAPAAQPTDPRMGAGVHAPEAGYSNVAVRYLHNGAFFGDDLKRHLRNNGFIAAGFTDYTFQLNDQGRPFWVVTRYSQTIGWSGDNATGVVTVDAQTGATREYTIADAPAWASRIQPDSFVQMQLDDWGQYVHGWLNSWWAKDDMIESSGTLNLVFGNDGRSYWYTDMRSANSTTSTIGFALVDSRTKKAVLYSLSGGSSVAAAEDMAARLFPEKRWAVSDPILYNVGNRPIYFMTLKGGSKIYKYVFADVRNVANAYGAGDSLEEAYNAFLARVDGLGQGNNLDELVKAKVITGTVLDVAHERSGNQEMYYLRIDGQNGVEFVADTAVSPELKWARAGHKVALQVHEGGLATVRIRTFHDADVNLKAPKH